MRIGFYIINKNIASVDCSDLYEGNPGVGGSEYAMFGLLNSLCINYKNSGFHYKLYLNKEQVIPTSIKDVSLVNNFEEAIVSCNNEDIDILVYKHSSEYIKENLFEKYSNKKLKFIVWSHNFVTRSLLNYYANSDKISRIVNVSFEQMDLYRDHLAFKKSTAIYNGLYTCYLNSDIGLNDRNNEITYIGSIIPAKGFHILAKAWKKILNYYPDAKLNVIGSGKLYNRDQVLGKYNIAEESYENEFIPYLVDEYGNLLNSVIFHGVLGQEKNEILGKTKIGVPNPSGKTETFGYTAVEMQCFGAIVTTKKTVGYNETVYDRQNLYANEDQLADKVINLLSLSSNLSSSSVQNFVNNNFDFAVIGEKWVQLFDRIDNGINESVSPVAVNELKSKIIEFNRKIKTLIPYGFHLIPSYIDFESLIFKLKNR